MKRSLLLVTAFLLMGLTGVQAQLKFGVKAGVNLSKIKYTSDAGKLLNDNIKNATGFVVGPMVEFTVPIIGIGMDAAVLYSQEGYKASITENVNEIVAHYKAHTLEIPVNLKYKFSVLDLVGVYGAAGPYAGFKLSDNLKEQYEDRSFATGLNFGAGVELLAHLQVGVQYKLGLTDDFSSIKKSDVAGAVLNKNKKQRTWTVSAAYFF